MADVVVFFSHEGENLINGEKQTLFTGHTEILARKIAETLSINSYRLKEVSPYPANHEEMLILAKKEQTEKRHVAYQPLKDFPTEIDTLFLGYPNWWGSYPQIVATFLDDIQTETLTIYPFCTHEGSAMGSSVEKLKLQCPESVIRCGLPVRGSRVDRSDVAVSNWLLAYQ